MGNKAYVVAVCGAGGKTTYCISEAVKYAESGKSVIISTTTHMQKKLNIDMEYDKFCYKGLSLVPFEEAVRNKSEGKIFFVGNVVDSDKICGLSEIDYKKICEEFDIVILEADGSRYMPLKIPKDGEPSIPDNVDKIVVLYGAQSIGRKIGVVCHRFEEIKNRVDYNTIVSKKLLEDLAKEFYINPLKKKYNSKEVDFKIIYMDDNDNYKNYKSISFVLCASGESKRFGRNKLIEKIGNDYLYEIVLSNIIEAKTYLINRLIDKIKIDITINLVTAYEEIIDNVKNKYKNIKCIYNGRSDKGLSESIKIGTINSNRSGEHCEPYEVSESMKIRFMNSNCDAICYFNMDVPRLTSFSIMNMIYNFIFSKKNIGVMCENKILKNPAIFSKKYYGEIMELTGDTGCKKIIEKHMDDVYMYHIESNELIDIDTQTDL